MRYGREYRYDGARQRYLNRELDPVKIQQYPPEYTPNSEVWSDYDGDSVYGDFTADTSSETITNITSYHLGMGRVTDLAGTPVTEYYHADMIGTTRVMTGENGQVVSDSTAAYMAFGELLPDSAAHRYGFVGLRGYQHDTFDEVGQLNPPLDPETVFPFLHVGARYYDPATGRFLQRDPIGIRGGLNGYTYVGANPLIYVDPFGLDAVFWSEFGRSVWDRSVGTADAFICTATLGIVDNIGIRTYDSENRANAKRVATPFVEVLDIAVGGGIGKKIVKSLIKKRAKRTVKKLLWEVM